MLIVLSGNYLSAIFQIFANPYYLRNAGGSNLIQNSFKTFYRSVMRAEKKRFCAFVQLSRSFKRSYLFVAFVTFDFNIIRSK